MFTLLYVLDTSSVWLHSYTEINKLEVLLKVSTYYDQKDEMKWTIADELTDIVYKCERTERVSHIIKEGWMAESICWHPLQVTAFKH